MFASLFLSKDRVWRSCGKKEQRNISADANCTTWAKIPSFPVCLLSVNTSDFNRVQTISTSVSCRINEAVRHMRDWCLILPISHSIMCLWSSDELKWAADRHTNSEQSQCDQINTNNNTTTALSHKEADQKHTSLQRTNTTEVLKKTYANWTKISHLLLKRLQESEWKNAPSMKHLPHVSESSEMSRLFQTNSV